MTWALAPFIADATLQETGIALPPYAADPSYLTTGFQLPLYIADANNHRNGLTLPTYIATTLGASTTIITPVGGVKVGGYGSIKGDPVIPVGGVRVGGAAPLSAVPSYHEPVGGVKTSGAATVVFNTPLITGSIAVTLPALSFTSSGAVSGDIEVVLPSAEFVATGTVATLGTMDVVLPEPDFLASADQPYIEVVFPEVDFGATGSVAILGAIDVIAPSLSFDSAGVASIGASIVVRLPKPQIAVTAAVSVIGSIVVTLPSARSSLTATRGIVGSIAVTLPKAKLALSGYESVLGTVAAVSPSATFTMYADITTAQFQTLVSNTITFALTEYANYPFESFTTFNGRVLGAGPTGLYLLDTGEFDQGTTAINAVAETGDLDFSIEYQKRMLDVYMGLRAAGDLKLSITVDEKDPVEYTLETYSVSRLKQRRVNTAKGERGKYWRYRIENVDGCDFEIDTINMTAVPTARRI